MPRKAKNPIPFFNRHEWNAAYGGKYGVHSYSYHHPNGYTVLYISPQLSPNNKVIYWTASTWRIVSWASWGEAGKRFSSASAAWRHLRDKMIETEEKWGE